jgi:gamma-carbonic anhydrase
MPIVKSYRGLVPRIAPDAFLAEDAVVIGDVEIGAQASVWYGTVLRGDMGRVRIGARTNVQDLACLHMTDGVSHALVGEDVTIGHGAIVHGAVIERGALIGMGAIVLDGVQVGEEALIAAGTVVTPRTVIPARVLVRGTPGKVVRELSDEEIHHNRLTVSHYLALAQSYRTQQD